MLSKQRVILVTGGTFGHVFPALMFVKLYNGDLFINETCRKFMKNPETATFFNYERTINPFITIKFIFYFWKILKNYDAIVVFGGYSCVPAIIAATFRNIKKYFHEQNANLSRGNILAYFLRFIPLLSFAKTEGIKSCKYYFKKPILFGYPVEKVSNNIKKENTILVFAGSGCSDFFDEFVAPIVSKFAKKHKYKVYFVAKNPNKVKKLFQKNDVVVGFIQDIDSIFKKVKLVIARSGAGSLSKIILFNNPTILIPLKTSTQNHQLLNAQRSGINYVEEDNIQNLTDLIEKTISEKQKNKKLQSNFILKII